MIKGSKPFLILTFLMSFSLAFYLANRAFPIFVTEVDYVKQIEAKSNKELPFIDVNGAVLEQIIGIKPNTVQLVYSLPAIVAYKIDADSLQASLEKKYQEPSKQVKDFLNEAKQDLILDYIFKDKNNTKVVTFKTKFLSAE